MTLTKETKAGVILVAVCMVVGALFLLSDYLPFLPGRGYAIYAELDSVQGMKRGDEVRYVGVRAGKIENIKAEGGKGQLTLRMDPKIKIPRDAHFTLDQDGLVGDPYVRISGGHDDGNYLSDGAKVEEFHDTRMEELLRKGKKLQESVEKLQQGMANMKSDEEGEK